MTSLLDIHTLLVSLILSYATSASALFVLRWKIPTIPGLWHFLLGTVLIVPACAIYAIESLPMFWAGVVANYLSVQALALQLKGVRLFYGKPLHDSWAWGLPLVCLSLMLWWTFVASTPLRVLITIVPMAGFCVGIAWAAVSHSRLTERAASLLITVGFGLFGVTLIARSVHLLWSPAVRNMDLGTLTTAATFLSSQVAILCGVLGLALVANQRVIEELRLSQHNAEAANRAKSDFLAVMSHEIRTPMNGIIGGISLLQNSPLDDRQQRYAETIDSSGKAMLQLLDGILDFSKIESGHVELESLEVDLRAGIEQTVRSFRTSATLKGLSLDLQFASGFEPTSVWGRLDPGRLRQVLSNLLANAVKFTATGGIKVRADIKAQEPPRLFVEVEDTGPGIDPEALDRLFLPFQQADASTTRRFGGTGLGLAISRRLIELMAGKIGVDSRPGGSTFWFELPFVSAPARTAQVVDSVATPDTPAAKASQILIVEDNPVNSFIAAEMLESCGHQVDIAEDGVLALEKLQQSSFDLIFMDCQMPRMDGYEATRQIRAIPALQSLPIIALTATVVENQLQRCQQAGMNDYLPKPVRLDDLQLMLDRWLLLASSSDKSIELIDSGGNGQRP